MPNGPVKQEAPTTSDEKVPVRNPSEVPDLTIEKEAREFWDPHEVTEEYLESTGLVAEEEMLERLKQLAAHKHKGYQTLLKEFVSERLYEEENHEGIIS